MNLSQEFGRRRVLRGMMGGAAIGVGLPFLDCFLNTNGTALADGTSLPVCYGSWYWGLGLNPGFWEPKIVGAKYEMAPQMQALSPYRSKINIFSGMKAYLDGKPVEPHITGVKAIQTGGTPRSGATQASLDSLIADVIGTRTRFRSLEVACNGNPSASYSQRAEGAVNPAETSPVALYSRIFGAEFKDPNAADFTPDPSVMLRRSALSMVSDERQAFLRQVGSSDRARLDEYFTSLRELEKRLELELQKPEPLKACTIPAKATESAAGEIVEDVLSNHKLFAQILAHALACGQTRIANIALSGPGSSRMRRAASPMTFHIYTHEEAIDEKTGAQPTVTWFQAQVMDAFATLVATLDGFKEGDGTLLDRMLMFASTDHGYAKVHSLENIPMMTAGGAGGRIKTGIHVQSKSDPVTRVGLTLQQVLGVPVSSWGIDSNQTTKTISEIVA